MSQYEEIVEIIEKGKRFYEELKNEDNSRYRSWEHCYIVFHEMHTKKKINEKELDNLCLHLAFYLASWGMYRGSSFLLERDYKVHKEVVKILLNEKYDSLWDIKVKKYGEKKYLDLLEDLMKEINKEYINIYTKMYSNKDNKIKSKEKTIISLTLITKVLMGTMGCTPAYDRYFIRGVREYNNFNITANNSSIKAVVKSIGELSSFYNNFLEFNDARKTMKVGNLEYPEMKVIDMCFWQTGKEIYEEEKRLKLGQ